MTVTIQLNSQEEYKLIEPLLKFIKEQGVTISMPKNPRFKQTPVVKTTSSNISRHRGIIQLPDQFDYKSFKANEFLTSDEQRG